jgi:hypothetical protein
MCNIAHVKVVMPIFSGGTWKDAAPLLAITDLDPLKFKVSFKIVL